MREGVTHSSAGSGADGAAAAASPGGGCSVGTAFEDLAGVDVGDTLFVGDPCKTDMEALCKRCVKVDQLSKNKKSLSHVHLTFVGDLKGIKKEEEES